MFDFLRGTSTWRVEVYFVLVRSRGSRGSSVRGKRWPMVAPGHGSTNTQQLESSLSGANKDAWTVR
jgi:hypothetical protein